MDKSRYHQTSTTPTVCNLVNIFQRFFVTFKAQMSIGSDEFRNLAGVSLCCLGCYLSDNAENPTCHNRVVHNDLEFLCLQHMAYHHLGSETRADGVRF